jgi:hypothetical protein
MMSDWIEGRKVVAVHVDSEVTIFMLEDGTQITITGHVWVQPPR